LLLASKKKIKDMIAKHLCRQLCFYFHLFYFFFYVGGCTANPVFGQGAPK